MASLFTTNGLTSIDFQHSGKRHRIRLGRVPAKQAQGFLRRLEDLLSADALGTPVTLETAQWLTSIDPKLHAKLVKIGLTTVRLDTLQDLIDAWLISLGPKTAAGSPVLAIVALLTSFFDARTRLREFNESSGLSFASFLATVANNGEPYAPATISRRLRSAKQLFAYAVRQKSIAENPFENVRGNGEVNKAKDFEVTAAMMDRLLECCDDVEFRAPFDI